MTRLLALALALVTAACTGATFGENGPGDGDGDGPDLGTYLEGGSIAVDGTNENVFVLSTESDSAGVVTDKRLMVAGPADTRARQLARLDNYEDLRLMFIDGGVMVMGERGGYDELVVYDRAATGEIDRASTSARYHGTRISGGGEFVAVADSSQPESSPIHIIRSSDLSIREIPHDGDWLEANWANTSDQLVAAVHYGSETAGELGQMRIVSWSIKSLATSGFPEANGFWANPRIDTTIPNAGLDPLFSFSWISVSPDDSIAVVPLVQRDAGDDRHRLAVVTLATGAVQIVDDARGPVGFTPDGSTIVSYRSVLGSDGETRPHLLMLDAETLEGEPFDEPSPGLIQYFVTRDGNYVVVGDFFGSSELTLVNLDNLETTKLGRAVDLHEFVSRPGTGELYLVDEGLFRVDLMAATLEEVELSFEPDHINRLPSDQLVVDDLAAERLVFLAPDDGATVRSVDLD